MTKLPIIPSVCAIGYDCVYSIPQGDTDAWLCHNPRDGNGNSDARCHLMSKDRIAQLLSPMTD